MFGLRLDRRDGGEDGGTLEAFREHEVGQLRFAFGQRPGLVQCHQLDALQGLQCLALADEDAQFCAAPGADHDRSRCGQSHCAGARDDQDGHGVDEPEGQRGVGAEDQPHGERQSGEGHDSGHEPHRDLIDQCLDRQFATLRGLHHADDLGQHRRFAHRRCAEGEGTGLVDGATGDGAAGGLFDGHGFARDHAFVDPACAGRDFAVDRHPLTGADLDHIAGADLGNGHLDRRAVPDDAGGLGLKADQPFDCLRRAALGAGLEIAAKQDQRHDHRCRLVVDESGPLRQHAGGEGGDQRIAVGGRGAHRDQAVHVGGQTGQRGQAFAKEAQAGAEQDGGGQGELDQPAGLHADGVHHRHVDPHEQVRPHLQHEHRQRQRGGNQHVALEQRLVCGFLRGGLVRRSHGRRSGAGLVPRISN